MIVRAVDVWSSFRRSLLAALTALSFAAAPGFARAQSLPTATRIGDLQVGGGFAFGASTYNFSTTSLLGESVYTAFDVRKHWGGEFDFHNVKSTVDTTVYERTYEFGARYRLNRGSYVPYAKLMGGRGVYNFHNGIANIGYNIVTVGAGVDYHVMRSWNLRLDYEYQTWPGFPLNTLHPNIVTIGFAYHVHE